MSKGFGGLELYVLKIALFLDKDGHEYEVFTKKNSFLSKRLADEKIYSDTLISVFHYFPLFSAIKLAMYIDSKKIDVIHVHWGKDLLLVVLAKIFSKRKIKLVYTRHMALTRKKDDFYHRFLYKNVDAYLVITKDLYKDAINYLPLEENKIYLIYHGVPAADSCQSDCVSYIEVSGLNDKNFRLVIFGRIEKGKGQHLVTAAVKELLKQGKNIQLAIIGHIMDESYYHSIKEFIKDNNLEKNIFYLGFHNSPTSIMRCFDAVVLATKCETFGLILPEAMRAGVAVIGSKCGGVPEIIEHEKTGLLFETENIVDLTAQILKLINDTKLCANLAQAGKKDADERFSDEKHLSQLMDIFKSA
ncbi:MAG: glycosyltransferase family 4 protein [Woeseiaceae bacterium]